MAKAYVSMREDKFSRAIVKSDSKTGGGLDVDVAGKTTKAVRRPLNGMNLPKDSYASMTIVSPSGKFKDILYNTSTVEKEESIDANKSSYTTNFIVQSVSESKNEKQQIVQTFGDDYVYFYGQQPVTLQVQAVLPESVEFQYAQEFWLNYGNALRGTSLVLKNARLYLTVAGQVFEGYMTSATTNKDAQNPRLVNLSFNMYVTNSYFIRSLVKYLPNNQGYYQKARQGDYINFTDYAKEDSYANKDRNIKAPSLTSIADALMRVGFGAYQNDLFARDTIMDGWKKTRKAVPSEASFPLKEGPTNDIQLVNTDKPLVQALSSKPKEDSLSFTEVVSTGLAVVAAGFVVAGVIKSVSDLVSETSLDDATNFIVDTATSAGEQTAKAIDAITVGLFNSGYRVLRPDKVGAVTKKSSKSSSESIDNQVLDI